MPLLIGYDLGGLDAKTRQALDHILAAVETWAGRVDGVNADERLNQLSSGIANLSTVPTGMISPWPTSLAPTGYLLCDGTAVNRDTYSTLYALIGTTYGAGNGTTTFNVPDLRQKFVLGKAASGTGSTLAGTGGTIDHTHTGPSHTHTGPSHTHTGPSHTHTISASGTHTHGATGLATSAHSGFSTITVDANLDGTTLSASSNGHVHAVTGSADADGDHTHTGATGSSGTGATGAEGTGATGASGTGATSTGNPPFMALNYVIKT